MTSHGSIYRKHIVSATKNFKANTTVGNRLKELLKQVVFKAYRQYDKVMFNINNKSAYHDLYEM